MKPLLVVTETPLNEIDLENIQQVASIENQETTSVELLVVYDIPQPLVFKVMDSLALFRLEEASRELVRAETGPLTLLEEARSVAQQAQSILEEKGFRVDTHLHQGEPIDALRSIIDASDPWQAVFITKRYAVEDTLNISWTNHAKDTLGLPVLHFHTGSTRIED